MHVSHKDRLPALIPICNLAERPLTNWDASSTRAHKCQQKITSNKKPAPFCKSHHFVRRKKKKSFKVVNPILLTNGYLHPIILSASRDVLFNNLVQSFLCFKFDFQSLHFKWGKEEPYVNHESHWISPFSSFPLHTPEMERVSKALSCA